MPSRPAAATSVAYVVGDGRRGDAHEIGVRRAAPRASPRRSATSSPPRGRLADVTRFMVDGAGHRRRSSIDAWFRLAFGCQFVWPRPRGRADRAGRLRRRRSARAPPRTSRRSAASTGCSGRTRPRRRASPASDVAARGVREEWSDALGRARVPTSRSSPSATAASSAMVAALSAVPTATCACRSRTSTSPSPRRPTTSAARGVGLALTAHAIDWAHEQGYPLDDDRLALRQPARRRASGRGAASGRSTSASYRAVAVDADRLDDRALQPRRDRACRRARARRSPTSSRRASTRDAARASSRRSASRAAASCTSRPRPSASRR